MQFSPCCILWKKITPDWLLLSLISELVDHLAMIMVRLPHSKLHHYKSSVGGVSLQDCLWLHTQNEFTSDLIGQLLYIDIKLCVFESVA